MSRREILLYYWVETQHGAFEIKLEGEKKYMVGEDVTML